MCHSLTNAIEQNCRIRKVREDKAPRSQLVAGAWRVQVHGVDWAWRVFCYSYTSTLFSSRSTSTLRVMERISPSSSLSSSIARLGVILCLHLSSLLFKISFYC